ncbi:MAG: hypothetical protein ABI068_12925 [Ktedonobacterales bacterium]
MRATRVTDNETTTEAIEAEQLASTAFEELRARRLTNWRQTPTTRLSGVAEATALINTLGVATLYPVSPELPNLLHAYSGDPTTQATSDWDSISGEVYTWRWTLGKQNAAFYTALARKRPTWISWALLPAALRLFGELRATDELYDMGVLSANAYHIVQALEAASEPLSTGDLRKAAGFPMGKEQRTAYLKAIEELETKLLLAKTFPADAGEPDAGSGDRMCHALVIARHPEAVRAADHLSREEALDQLLTAYLPYAFYALPTPLARTLPISEAELRTAFDRLVERAVTRRVALPSQKAPCYVWREG